MPNDGCLIDRPSKVAPDPDPKAKRKPAQAAPNPHFEAFWAAYPRKTAKGAARKAWPAAEAKAAPGEISAGLKRYIATKPSDIAYCYPATWLNGERWLDEERDGRGEGVPNGKARDGPRSVNSWVAESREWLESKRRQDHDDTPEQPGTYPFLPRPH